MHVMYFTVSLSLNLAHTPTKVGAKFTILKSEDLLRKTF